MRIERLTGEGEALDQLIKIYEEAIPASEKKPAAVLRGMVARSDYRVGVGYDGERVVGFGIVYEGAGFALLEYLAVEKEVRSRGVGRGLFAWCAEGGRPMVVEVEEAVDEVKARRVAFYRRMGCREVEGLEYELPLPGEQPGMRVMVMGVEGESVSKGMVEGWLREIYSKVYGVGEGDERLGRMVERLPGRIRLHD